MGTERCVKGDTFIIPAGSKESKKSKDFDSKRDHLAF